MGIAVLDYDRDTGAVPIAAWCVATHKSTHADRVTEDDARRMSVLWAAIDGAIREYNPDVIAVEAYTVYKPTQGGHAGKGAGWKALYAYAMTCGAAFAHSKELRVYLPSDLKRRVGRAPDATKGDVQAALCAAMPQAADILRRTAASNREHAADALGHALMAAVDEWHARCMVSSTNAPDAE